MERFNVTGCILVGIKYPIVEIKQDKITSLCLKDAFVINYSNMKKWQFKLIWWLARSFTKNVI